VPRLEELDYPRKPCGDVLAGDAAGMEGTHRELRARLADGLGRDDADGLAHVDGAVRGEGPSVARLADALRALALGRRPDRDQRLARQLLLPLRQEARHNVRAGLGDDLARLRVDEVAGKEAGRDGVVPVAPPAVEEERDVDVPVGAAVLVVHDDVLGDVDEAAGQVARVRGTEGGVAWPFWRRGSR
jgi:hypothetical protein